MRGGLKDGNPKACRSNENFLILSIALAAISLVLLISTLVASLPRADFFADDLLWAQSQYSGALGVFDTSVHLGRVLSNVVYWQFATTQFGFTSIIPYVLVNVAFVLMGISIWILVWAKRGFPIAQVLIAGSLALASATFLPTVIWASNVTHTLGFALFSIACAVAISVSKPTPRVRQPHTLVILAVVSSATILASPNYVIAISVLWAMLIAPIFFNSTRTRLILISATLTTMMLVATCIYVVHAVRLSPAYGASLSALPGNLVWYWEGLAGARGLIMIGLLIVITAVGVRSIQVMRSRDYLPVFLLSMSVLIAATALLQPAQRGLHYLFSPLFLVALAGIVSFYPRTSSPTAVRWLFASSVCIVFVGLVIGGSYVRQWTIASPNGSSLTAVKSFVQEDTRPLCIVTTGTAEADQLIAESSTGRAFAVPFTSAPSAVVTDDSQLCADDEFSIFVNRAPDGRWRLR